MCAWSAVVHVAENMEIVDGEALNDVADGYDKVVSRAGGDDGIGDGRDIGCLVHVIGALVQQFLYDVGELSGQCHAHFGTCVFA